MKITVEFENLQELDEFCNGVAIAPALAKKVSTSTETAQEAPKAPEAKKSTPKKAEAQEEAKTEEAEAPAEAPVEEAPAKEEKKKKAAGHSEGDLKLLLSDKLKAGKKAEVKKLFEKYGVTCLTALFEAQKDNLDAVYEEAEGI